MRSAEEQPHRGRPAWARRRPRTVDRRSRLAISGSPPALDEGGYDVPARILLMATLPDPQHDMWTLVSLSQGATWPDLTPLPPVQGGGESDAAVIVGIESYASVDPVPGARANAEEWYRYLVKVRNIPSSQAFLLVDEQAINVQILETVKTARSRVGPQGTLWFVFIGHGAPGKDGTDGLLVGADATRSAVGILARSVSHSELLASLEVGPQARTLLVLDACYSGKTAEGSLVEGLQPLVPSYSLPAGHATVLSAARADQFAGPLPGLGRPAFSYLVLGVLRGWGDQDWNGQVTAQEAVAYAGDVLLQVVHDRRQEPEILGGEGGVVMGLGREAGPVVADIVLQRPPSDGPVVTTGGGDYASRVKALEEAKIQREQAAAKETAARAQLVAEQERQLTAAQAQLLAQAASNWGVAQDLVQAGGPEAITALESFIEAYQGAQVSIDDRVQAVQVPQVQEARALLEKLRPSSPTGGLETRATAPPSPRLPRNVQVLDFPSFNQPPPDLDEAAAQKRKESIAWLKGVLKGAPDPDQSADASVRLARLYVEEALYVRRMGSEAYMESLPCYATGTCSAHLVAPPSKKSNAWMKKGVPLCQGVLENSPTFEHSDEARWLLAQALRDLGRQEEMSATLRDLVTKNPTSPWVPHAYIVLGDVWFDQDTSQATQMYRNAAAYTTSEVLPYALYRLAWCQFDAHDPVAAIVTMSKARDAAIDQSRLDEDFDLSSKSAIRRFQDPK